jgi:hypothetical protein
MTDGIEQGHKTKKFDNLTIAAIFGSLAVGGLVGFIATPVDGILTGLLLVLLTELLQLSYRTRRSNDLYAMAIRVDWLPAAIENIVRLANELTTRSRSDVLLAEFKENIDALTSQGQDLERGIIVRSSDNYSDLIGETLRCQVGLEAVTNVTSERLRDGTAWWLRPQGREYWNSNLDLLKKGRPITRVFIIDTLDEYTEKLMKEQSSAGVDVRYILSEELKSEYQLNIAIWDGGIAWRAAMSALGIIIEHQLLLETADVRRVKRLYEACLAESVPFGPEVAKKLGLATTLSNTETHNEITKKDAQPTARETPLPNSDE